MPIFKVKIDTWWIVEAKTEQAAIDFVADDQLPALASDYDNFDTTELTEPLSEDDKAILLQA